MGRSRKFDDRKSSITQAGVGERGKILTFDPTRRNLRSTAEHIPKLPDKPSAPTSMLRRAIRNAIAFLLGISRVLRSQSRGAESSGKRRA